MSDRAPLLHSATAEQAALLLGTLNSLVLDFAARSSVGGTDLSYFIVKQLPVLPPELFLEEALVGDTYAELIVPRVLELTYTADDMAPFARDLGYDGPPFAWDDDRRLQLRCEIDAVIAHLYQLDRPDLEWILDAQPPSESFRGLKHKEIAKWKEYRTMRLVLESYDLLAAGKPLPTDTPGKEHA